MFAANFNPVFLQLGPVQIRYYGIVYVLGFLLMYAVLKRNRKKLKMSVQAIDDLIVFLIIGLIAGARLLFFLFEDPSMLYQDPLELFRIWKGGMSFFGGFLGSIIGVSFALKKHKLKFYPIADILVIAASLILVFGRLANFINMELVGRVTDVSWCFTFPGYEGCRHPYQLYAALSHLILFGILLYMYRREHKDGSVFWMFVLLYGLFRFITDFFRADPVYFGLTVWQYVSIAAAAVGGWYYAKK